MELPIAQAGNGGGNEVQIQRLIIIVFRWARSASDARRFRSTVPTIDWGLMVIVPVEVGRPLFELQQPRGRLARRIGRRTHLAESYEALHCLSPADKTREITQLRRIEVFARCSV